MYHINNRTQNPSTFVPTLFIGVGELGCFFTLRETYLLEMALYSRLQKMCEEYNGAYWYMYNLSNGAMYLAPAIENRKLRLTVDTNGYSGEVSGDAAGLITCLFVFNALCWKYPQREDFVDLFYKLRDFAFDHPEAEGIIAAID